MKSKVFDYVIVSTAVTDRIQWPDRDGVKEVLGGAGIYALCGIHLWTDQAVLVTGIGEDFSKAHWNWFVQNKCATDGLRIKDAHTAISDIQYFMSGERIETPVYGIEQYRKMESNPKDIEPYLHGAKGVYVFKGTDAGFWEEMLEMKKRYGFKLLWEINSDAAVPNQRENIRAICEQCDAFSINRMEACNLFGVEELSQARKAFMQWDEPLIYLRVGGAGAEIIHRGTAVKIPPVTELAVVDPTGAGNSSSAAVLYGLCCGEAPSVCGLMGSISASICITQYGPPNFTSDSRTRARWLLDKMVADGQADA